MKIIDGIYQLLTPFPQFTFEDAKMLRRQLEEHPRVTKGLPYVLPYLLKAGERVLMWYLSANRDEDMFSDPYTFDITRTPNEHLAFGIGEHFCLGAGFARKELKVMFEELFRRFPDIEVDGPAERLRSNFINGIKHLPVKFTPESQ